MSRRADERSGWGRWTAFVKLVLFALFLLAVPNGAMAKIGLDLEWRPIEGLEPPPAKEEKPADKESQKSGKAGEVKTFTVNGVSFKMVRIPAGEFMMGSPPDEPGRGSDETQHRVRISSDFWMGQTEVTQGLWKAVMGSNPSKFSNCGDDCPVEGPSLWKDRQEFLRRLNNLVSGGGFRLPTEAEWEYACRGGTTGPYAGELDAMGWYYNNSENRTHRVAQKRPNAWGLYDMHGNVWEWCPAGENGVAFRGGSWNSNAIECRAAVSAGLPPAELVKGVMGLRLAATD
jgi:formylglycine-generating enzyme required for sulfatase activity